MAQWQVQSITALLLLKMGKYFRFQAMDLMYGFLTQETAEYYPFLKGKIERWVKEEWYVILQFLFI